MNNPPLNALSHALRAGSWPRMRSRARGPQGARIVIIGNERAFSSGADIKEFAGGAFYADPFLPAVVDIVEAASKPVIAAISGACMGGGLELALGCHYRVARGRREDRFPGGEAGPDPGAGGTQRFPRLVGPRSGGQHDRLRRHGSRVRVQGHRVVRCRSPSDSLEAAARDFARKLVKEAKPIRRVRDLPCQTSAGRSLPAVREDQRGRGVARACGAGARARGRGRRGVAEFRCGHRDRAQDVRRAHGQRGIAGAASCVLRRTRGVQESRGSPTRRRSARLRRVAVVGAGTMGGGIAMSFANAGHSGHAARGQTGSARSRHGAAFASNTKAPSAKGKLKPDDAAARAALITPSLDYAAAANGRPGHRSRVRGSRSQEVRVPRRSTPS